VRAQIGLTLDNYRHRPVPRSARGPGHKMGCRDAARTPCAPRSLSSPPSHVGERPIAYRARLER